MERGCEKMFSYQSSEKNRKAAEVIGKIDI